MHSNTSQPSTRKPATNQPQHRTASLAELAQDLQVLSVSSQCAWYPVRVGVHGLLFCQKSAQLMHGFDALCFTDAAHFGADVAVYQGNTAVCNAVRARATHTNGDVVLYTYTDGANQWRVTTYTKAGQATSVWADI